MPKSIHHHFVVSCFVSLGICTCKKWQTCFFSAKWINNKAKKGRVTWRKAQAMTWALNDEVISIYDTLMLDNTLRFQENSIQPSIWDVCLNIHKIFRRFFFNLLKCAYSMCMYICHFISTFFSSLNTCFLYYSSFFFMPIFPRSFRQKHPFFITIGFTHSFQYFYFSCISNTAAALFFHRNAGLFGLRFRSLVMCIDFSGIKFRLSPVIRGHHEKHEREKKLVKNWTSVR